MVFCSAGMLLLRSNFRASIASTQSDNEARQSAAFSLALARQVTVNDPTPISRDNSLSINLYNQDLAPDLDI